MGGEKELSPEVTHHRRPPTGLNLQVQSRHLQGEVPVFPPPLEILQRRAGKQAGIKGKGNQGACDKGMEV